MWLQERLVQRGRVMEVVRVDENAETDRIDFLSARNWCADVISAYESPEDMPAMLKIQYAHRYNIYESLGEKYGWS